MGGGWHVLVRCKGRPACTHLVLVAFALVVLPDVFLAGDVELVQNILHNQNGVRFTSRQFFGTRQNN